MTHTINDSLLVNNEQDYGDGYRDHCLEIYKLYVEKADTISSRRQSANSFFLTINTAIMGVSGYTDASNLSIKLALSVAGVLLCYYWYRLILSYKQLNTGKFKVIHEIEQKLPLAPYDAEWKAVGEGKDRKIYMPFTSIEMNVPWVFLCFHITIILLTSKNQVAEFIC